MSLHWRKRIKRRRKQASGSMAPKLNMEEDVIYTLKNFCNLDYQTQLDLIDQGRPMPEIRDVLSKSSRSFRTEWYARKDWLCGCPARSRLFCFPCLLFSTRDSVWTQNGYGDMKNLQRSLGKHERSTSHIHSQIALKTFGSSMIDSAADEQHRLAVSIHNAKVQTNAFTVIFDERFSVAIDVCALEERSLRFAAFGIDSEERNISAGVAELKLSDLDLTIRPFNAWLYLQDVNKVVDAVGEILLSLSYLPTAERLTVVVAKCKNLLWTDGKNTADPFVKVYLLQDGRKISKKKTSTKRDDTNPIFNEAMIFSVPSLVLQELSLRVTVAESSDDGRGENLGHVIIGPETGGMGITHWNQMLATLRKPVSMWHPLRRI
ncbi:synaptotagmin-12 isoform X3 [Hippocampus zosterae]|uniref:synaptotagmin-12 isoform X3 n=1 Tax=Hippocampus zosterae TaxID=109293 RepID=UPI00223DF219|nr:synaptotagmin-12 isoform X3 [Hippocampus zosterae]